MENSMEVPQKTKYRTTIWPSNPTLGTYPDKTFLKKDTCTHMFISALFTIAKTWKQHKCPSTDEWIKKMWYIYTMEYYWAIQKNKMPFVATWMEPETLILSEVSQKEKEIYHIISHIWNLIHGTNEPFHRKEKLMDLENRLVLAKGEGVGVGWTGNLRLIDGNYCIWSR